MKEDGVTLIELIVVVSVIAVLVFALGFTFQTWMGGYNIESQVKQLHVDLMNARARAMQRNRCHFVVVTANNYQIFEDANENCVYDVGTDTALTAFTSPKTLTYTSNWIGRVTMDTRGIVSNNVTPLDATIQFNIGTNTPDYDCIVLFATRINMGKWNGSCVAK
jgi:prepilin-type N-terminal cleavage/methylation domain-containing protein